MAHTPRCFDIETKEYIIKNLKSKEHKAYFDEFITKMNAQIVAAAKEGRKCSVKFDEGYDLASRMEAAEKEGRLIDEVTKPKVAPTESLGKMAQKFHSRMSGVRSPANIEGKLANLEAKVDHLVALVEQMYTVIISPPQGIPADMPDDDEDEADPADGSH